jgi:hypothetical protein
VGINIQEIRAEITIALLLQGCSKATELESAIDEATERVMRIIEREERA